MFKKLRSVVPWPVAKASDDEEQTSTLSARPLRDTRASAEASASGKSVPTSHALSAVSEAAEDKQSPSQAATFAGASRGDAPPLVSNNASASSRASADVEEAGAFEAPPDDLTPWAFVNQPPRNAVYELQYRTIKNPKLWFELLGASALLFAFCALYLGPVWIPQQRFNNLSCGVVSCDAGGPPQAPLPPFGASLVATLFKAGTLGFKPFSCDCASGGCRAALVTAVDRGELWSAIYVNENFTADVLSHAPSLGLGNATTQAQVEHIFAQGRSYTTLSFMRTVVNLTVAPISAGFGQQLIDASAAGAGPAFSPSFFLSPFTLRETNLAPVRVFGEHFASYLLCLLLWMGSAFTVSLSFQYKTSAEVAAAAGLPVSIARALLSAIEHSCVGVVFAFVQAATLVSVIFVLGTDPAAGGAVRTDQWVYSPGYCIAFAAYLQLSFLAINSLSLVLLGQEKFTAITTLLLILQLSSCGAFYSPELSPPFYCIGEAFPFLYGVRTFRTIFFGTQDNQLPLSWGIVTAWNGACFVLYAACTVVRLHHRKLVRPPLQALRRISISIA